MWSRIKKFARTSVGFLVGSVLFAATLWGIWMYVSYHTPRVLVSEALPSPPESTATDSSSATSPPPGAGQDQTSATALSEDKQMSVTVVGNTGGLMTTLATALFGGVGWLLSEARKTLDKALRKRYIWASLLAAICASISIFSGALGQGHLVSMLWNDSLNLRDPVFTSLCLAQFAFLCLGAGCLTGFAFYNLSEGDSDARE